MAISEPHLELRDALATVPPDLALTAAGLYRRLVHVQTALLTDLGQAAQEPSDSSINVAEVEDEIHSSLNDCRERLEELSLAEEEYETPLERDGVRQAAIAASKDLDALTSQTTQVLLFVRQTIRQQDRAAPTSGAAARAALGLDTGGAYRTRRTATSNDSGQDQVAQASTDVTSALERAVTLMSEEVSKSTFSAELLQESSDAMDQLGQSYTSFGGLLHASQTMVKKLQRQDVQDRLAVYASLAFFLACVAYILKQRLIDPTFGGIVGLVGGGVRSVRWVARKVAPAPTSNIEAPPVLDWATTSLTTTTTAAVGAAVAAAAATTTHSSPYIPPTTTTSSAHATGETAAPGGDVDWLAIEQRDAPVSQDWIWEHDPVLDADWNAGADRQVDVAPEQDKHVPTPTGAPAPVPPEATDLGPESDEPVPTSETTADAEITLPVENTSEAVPSWDAPVDLNPEAIDEAWSVHYDSETGERIFPSGSSTEDQQDASEPPTDQDQGASPIEETINAARTTEETISTDAPHTRTTEESSDLTTNSDSSNTNDPPFELDTYDSAPPRTGTHKPDLTAPLASSEPTEFTRTPQSHKEDHDTPIEYDWLAPEPTESTEKVEFVEPGPEVEVSELENLSVSEYAQPFETEPIDPQEAWHPEAVEVDPATAAEPHDGTDDANMEPHVTESDLNEGQGKAQSEPGFASDDSSQAENQHVPVPEPQPEQEVVSEQHGSGYQPVSKQVGGAPQDVDETEATVEPEHKHSTGAEHSATAQPTRSSVAYAESADGEEVLSASADPEWTKYPYHVDL